MSRRLPCFFVEYFLPKQSILTVYGRCFETELNNCAELTSALKTRFDKCDDFAMRPINAHGRRAVLCFIKNICDRKYLAESVVAPLLNADSPLPESAAVTPCTTADQAVEALLGGNAVLAVDTAPFYCISIAADSFPHRSIGEPTSDVTVRGPHAGFNENGEESLATLRRIIKNPALKALSLTVGSLTATKVFVVYLEGRASKRVLTRIETALKEANVSCVADSGNIEQILCPRGSVFPTVGSSEKADKVASKIIAGRIAVICDGSPAVLTAPYVFAESIQSAEDYLKPAWYATFMRFLRFFALLASAFLPAIFTAAVYHDGFLVPRVLMESLEAMEKDIKLPFIAEILLMLTAFEVVREVGVRMPRTVGDAVGLVASLLVGDATVEAGLAGTATLLIVAFSETTAFIVPAMNVPLTLFRYLYVFAAYFAGMYGLLFAFGATVILLVTKKSFGAGYLTPLIPFSAKGMQDFLFADPQKTLGRKEKLK